MTRDITPIKWIIGAIALLIIIAGACYLWYRYDTAPYRQEASDAAELARRLENQQAKQKAATETETASTKETAENTTAKKPVNENTAEVENNTEAEINQQAGTPVDIAVKSDEKVSPYGFGPYPKLPQDFPEQDFWEFPRDKNMELMDRVLVKLWEQGKRPHGVTMEKGLVYPTLPNTLIVKWKTEITPFGTRKKVVSVQYPPEAASFIRSHQPLSIYESDIPAHFKVIEFKDAGIDPYQFLDLP
ncbi:MAG: hypothetical protein OXI67_21735 [Candidatus Poribacteria bacterium]|nr:hypothetical protein [Candidatus Poribacteria bacterium]